MSHSYLPLCLITQIEDTPLPVYQNFLDRVCRGGVTLVQLREKQQDAQEILRRGRALQEVLSGYQIPLIVNDNVTLACQLGADGVHLGQTDLSPAYARQQLGPEKIIGWSIECWADLHRANQDKALTYITASAVFPSKNKTNLKTIWGLAQLKELICHSHYPLTAIGGIDLDNVNTIVEQGVQGIAVIGALHDATDPKHAAQLLRQSLPPT